MKSLVIAVIVGVLLSVVLGAVGMYTYFQTTHSSTGACERAVEHAQAYVDNSAEAFDLAADAISAAGARDVYELRRVMDRMEELKPVLIESREDFETTATTCQGGSV